MTQRVTGDEMQAARDNVSVLEVKQAIDVLRECGVFSEEEAADVEERIFSKTRDFAFERDLIDRLCEIESAARIVYRHQGRARAEKYFAASRAFSATKTRRGR